MALALNDSRHGTTNGYNNHGCRCDPCTAAWRDYHRQYIQTHDDVRVRQNAKSARWYADQVATDEGRAAQRAKERAWYAARRQRTSA